MVTLITEKLRVQKLHDDEDQFSLPSFRVEKIIPSTSRAASARQPGGACTCDDPQRIVDNPRTPNTRVTHQWRPPTRKKKSLTQRLGKCSAVAPATDPSDRLSERESHRFSERLGSAGSVHSCCSDSGVSGLTSPGPASADGSLVSDGCEACDELIVGSPAHDPPIKRHCRSLSIPEHQAHARLTVLGHRSQQMLRPQPVRMGSKANSRSSHHTSSPRQRSRHQSAGGRPGTPGGSRPGTPADRPHDVSGERRRETAHDRWRPVNRDQSEMPAESWRPVSREYSPLPLWQQGSASVDCLSVVGLGLGSDRIPQAFGVQLNRSLSQDGDDMAQPNKHDVSCSSETSDSVPSSPLRQPTQRCKSQPSLQQFTPRARLKRRRHERPSINFAKMSETCIERSHRKRLYDSQATCNECEHSYCIEQSDCGEPVQSVCAEACSPAMSRCTRRTARCSNTPSMLSLPENLEESDSGCSDNELDLKQSHADDTRSDDDHVTSLSEMNAEIDLDQMENN